MSHRSVARQPLQALKRWFLPVAELVDIVVRSPHFWQSRGGGAPIPSPPVLALAFALLASAELAAASLRTTRKKVKKIEPAA